MKTCLCDWLINKNCVLKKLKDFLKILHMRDGEGKRLVMCIIFIAATSRDGTSKCFKGYFKEQRCSFHEEFWYNIWAEHTYKKKG